MASFSRVQLILRVISFPFRLPSHISYPLLASPKYCVNATDQFESKKRPTKKIPDQSVCRHCERLDCLKNCQNICSPLPEARGEVRGIPHLPRELDLHLADPDPGFSPQLPLRFLLHRASIHTE